MVVVQETFWLEMENKTTTKRAEDLTVIAVSKRDEATIKVVLPSGGLNKFKKAIENGPYSIGECGTLSNFTIDFCAKLKKSQVHEINGAHLFYERCGYVSSDLDRMSVILGSEGLIVSYLHGAFSIDRFTSGPKFEIPIHAACFTIHESGCLVIGSHESGKTKSLTQAFSLAYANNDQFYYVSDDWLHLRRVGKEVFAVWDDPKIRVTNISQGSGSCLASGNKNLKDIEAKKWTNLSKTTPAIHQKELKVDHIILIDSLSPSSGLDVFEIHQIVDEIMLFSSHFPLVKESIHESRFRDSLLSFFSNKIGLKVGVSSWLQESEAILAGLARKL